MTSVFVTVGGQMPFDRLIRTVDQWASEAQGVEVFAQIGGGAAPVHMRYVRTLPPAEYLEVFRVADAVVAHAGMGTILTALRYGKPLLVLPRHSALGETRNDHQIPTAEHFARKEYLTAAMTEEELHDRLVGIDQLRAPAARIGDRASDELIAGLRRFLEA